MLNHRNAKRISLLGILLFLFGGTAWGAVNRATDPGGGSVGLLSSGDVTVNSTALQLVKQVWDNAGSTCLASSPADAACNSGVTSVSVASGKVLNFLIFVRNPTDTELADIRFQDLLDDSATGFTYTANSIQRTANDGTAPADSATLATIFGATTIAQSDGFDNTDFAGIDTTASPDNLLVGGDGTAGNNATLSVPANKTFAIRFTVTKQ